MMFTSLLFSGVELSVGTIDTTQGSIEILINTDTDINLALLQLGKNRNRYRLDQNIVPHAQNNP